MILANYAQQNRNCVRELGQGFTNPFSQFKPQMLSAYYMSGSTEVVLSRASLPTGYSVGYAWKLPPKPGGMGSRRRITGAGEVTYSNLAGGYNAVASLSGSGDITNAALGLIASAQATLSGSGDLTGSLAGILSAAATLTGAGDLTGALGALAGASATLTGGGDVSSAILSAIGHMSAEIVVTGDLLSTANVGEAVWSAIAASFNDAGTMGEKMNDAGSAANPWTEEIETGYTAEELLRLISAVLLGQASGGGTSVRTFRDVNDTTDRVVADVETDGDRTTVTLDAN